MKLSNKFLVMAICIQGSLLSVNYSIDINMNQFREVWHSKQHDYYSIQLNGEHFSGTRPWEIRWEKIKNATSFEKKRVLDIGTSVGLCPLFISLYLNPQKVVAFDNEKDAVYHAKQLMNIFNTNYELLELNLDKDSYEQTLGYDYDIVICMSVYNWVKQQQRLLNYLSHFNEIIFEGHDSISTETSRLKSLGFKEIKILGATDRNRHLIYATK